PAIFDRNVLPFDVTGLGECFPERGHNVGPIGGGGGVDQSDHRHRRLLRTRRERPRRRAAEGRDEVAPPHSITSSARASSVGGTSKRSAFAVLRLITSSNLVG